MYVRLLFRYLLYHKFAQLFQFEIKIEKKKCFVDTGVTRPEEQKIRQRDTTHNSANFINHLLSHTLSIMNANSNGMNSKLRQGILSFIFFRNQRPAIAVFV